MAKNKLTKSTKSKGSKVASRTHKKIGASSSKKAPVVDRGVLIFGIAILAIIALVLFFKDNYTSTPPVDVLDIASGNKVVATVNGYKITQSELDMYYALEVPPEAQFQVPKADYLDKGLIPQILLYQEAQKQGIIYTLEDAQKQFDESITQSGVTKEAVLQQFEDNNINVEDYLDTLVVKLAVIELLNQSVDVEDVTDEMVKDFYDTNKEIYFMQEGVVIPFEEVKDDLKDALQVENQRIAITAFVEPHVEELKQKSVITVSLE